MLDRRSVLFAGLAAGCAAPALAPAGEESLRALVIALEQETPRARARALRRLEPARLSAEDRILHAALAPGAEAEAALADFSWGADGRAYAVTHRSGAWRSAARGEAAARVIDLDTERLRADAGRGVIAPNFLIDAAVSAIAAAAGAASNDGPRAAALARQLEALLELRPRAGAEAGVWRLPGGEPWYALALQLQLGAQSDPREAHAHALDRCRELQAEADALLRAAGLARGPVGERIAALSRDHRWLYPASEAGKAAAVAHMNAALQRLRPLLSGAIEGASEIQAEVRLVPPEEEANGAAGRRAGATYWVDLGAIRTRPIWTLASVAYHEALPGHILQARWEDRANPPSLQRRYAQGYSEGWASYAEHLADALGAYAGDPLSRLGYLHWMLFRMARVVADTGVHAMRWSRARAIDEMRALQGESIAFVSIEEDVARICAQPGAAAAQGLAALHLIGARRASRLDARRFHAAALHHGPLSPAGLDQALRAAA